MKRNVKSTAKSSEAILASKNVLYLALAGFTVVLYSLLYAP